MASPKGPGEVHNDSSNLVNPAWPFLIAKARPPSFTTLWEIL
jgi:hypothetical protein